METYALFGDQSASRILYEFFNPDPGDDPVRLAFPDIEDIQVRNSARNGCLSAYHILSRTNYIHRGKGFFPSCQFADASANLHAQGDSAGLAFCLKFVQEVYGLSIGKTLDYAIAATGVISDGTREARIERVEGINPKLSAAVDLLEAGDRVFFPAANEPDIEPDINQKAADKGIRLVPVSTVEQAIGELLPPPVPPSPRRFRKVPALFVALAGALILYLAYQSAPDPESLIARVIEAQEQGNHLQARELLDEFLQREGEQDERVLELSHQLSDSLDLGITFHYLKSGQQGTRPISPSHSSRDPVVLRSGDLYRFSCTMSDSGFLYAYQVDSRGKLDRLPGASSSSGPVRLEAGSTRFLPPGETDWYALDEQDGQETIYFVASRRPGRDLEKIYAQLLRAPETKKGAIRRTLMEKIKTRAQAREAGIMGIFYAAFTFQHLPGDYGP